MSHPARNDYRGCLYAKSRGIALLIMLALILLAFTSIAISRLSINSIEHKSRAKTTASLAEVRAAIMGFALAQGATDARPPGTLPCPDTDGDGASNDAPAGTCTSQRGLVPFVTLSLPRTLDGTGAPLWYAIARGYGGNAVAPFIPRNSSLLSPLATTLSLDGLAMAFIVIAPNVPLSGQQSTTTPLATVGNFLEAPNNGANPNYIYSDVYDTTHNDQALGMPVGEFWASIEKRVLVDVRDLLNNYRTRCNRYPWAATYTLGPPLADNNSTLNNLRGLVPLDFASPFDWGFACGGGQNAPTVPVWMARHWQDMFYYAICPPNLPSPPSANCLELDGDGDLNDAHAIVMAPGIPLTTTVPLQDRSVTADISDYFEGENASPVNNTFTNTPPMGTFNDHILIVP